MSHLDIQIECFNAQADDLIEFAKDLQEQLTEANARVERLEENLAELRKALLASDNALHWYKDAHPESWSEADEEHRMAVAALLEKDDEQRRHTDS